MPANQAATVAHKLEHTLLQWRQWHCQPPLEMAPAVDHALESGLSNHSFLTAGEPKFVIRIDGQDPQAHGLNRAIEWRALADAWQAGIAPRPVYHNLELGCQVCQYLVQDARPANSEHAPEAIAGLLQQIHQLPPRHFRLDIGARIDNYCRRIDRSESNFCKKLLRLRPTVDGLLGMEQAKHHPLVLCHNDLLISNRIWSAGTLYAIDWEFCAMAPGLYDLAVTIEGDELGADAAQHMLCAYLGRTPLQQETQSVDNYRAIYAYLALLWYAVTDAPTAATGSLDTKLEQLADRARTLASCTDHLN